MDCTAGGSIWRFRHATCPGWDSLGDLLVHGEAAYGELAKEDQEAGGYEYKTLREAKYVANAVPLSIRMDKLGFSHHQLVAPLYAADEDGNQTEESAEAQRSWLQRAVDNSWSVAEMRGAIRDDKLKRDRAANPLPGGRRGADRGHCP